MDLYVSQGPPREQAQARDLCGTEPKPGTPTVAGLSKGNL